MKKFCFSLAIIATIALVVRIFGLYPIASVDGRIIFARTWWRILDAEKQVINVHAYASHEPLIDFSAAKHATLLTAIRESTLTLLIDAVLMQREGLRVVPGLEQLSVERVNDELRSNNVSEAAASAVYGLDLATLREIVLIPQARHEILAETLAAQGTDISEWLPDIRRRAKVRFFFVPFTWDREGVK